MEQYTAPDFEVIEIELAQNISREVLTEAMHRIILVVKIGSITY